MGVCIYRAVFVCITLCTGGDGSLHRAIGVGLCMYWNGMGVCKGLHVYVLL